MQKEKHKQFLSTSKIQEEILNNVKSLPNVDWKVQQYNYLYIVHKIITHSYYKDKRDKGCLINMKYLGNLFSKSNKETSAIIRNLIKWRIIYIVKEYIQGERSRSYKLVNFDDKDKIIYIPIGVNNIKFITKLFEQEGFKSKKYIISKTLFILNNYIYINNEGIKYLECKYNIVLLKDGCLSECSYIKYSYSVNYGVNEYEQFVRGVGIEQRDIPLWLIYCREFYCTRPKDKNNKLSRIYHNLTNLPREHRQFINFKGHPLLMTDISNSQILLTVPLLFKLWYQLSGVGAKNIPVDLLKFKELAESGSFYESFQSMQSSRFLKYVDRSDFKKIVFEAIWFGQIDVRRYKSVTLAFQKHFPTAHGLINKMKENNYAQFAITLQRFEAEIIIDKVQIKLLREGYDVLSLHDAIITTDAECLKKVEIKISAALDVHNVKPKFKQECETFISCCKPKVIDDTLITLDTSVISAA